MKHLSTGLLVSLAFPGLPFSASAQVLACDQLSPIYTLLPHSTPDSAQKARSAGLANKSAVYSVRPGVSYPDVFSSTFAARRGR